MRNEKLVQTNLKAMKRKKGVSCNGQLCVYTYFDVAHIYLAGSRQRHTSVADFHSIYIERSVDVRFTCVIVSGNCLYEPRRPRAQSQHFKCERIA